MLSYLQKFNDLPKEIRDRVKSSEISSVINGLENKYGVKLASAIMKIVVGEVLVSAIDGYLAKELSLEEKKVKELAKEIKERILDKVFRKNETTMAPTTETYLIKYEKGRDGSQAQLEKIPPTPPYQGGNLKADEPLTVKGSNFFFSPDDEEEIRELVKKINVPETPRQEDVKEKVAKVFDELQINFGSEFLSDRFKKIIETYLKGIRNRMETKATLQKPFEQGGLSFDEESVAKILNIMDGYRADMGGEAKASQPRKIVLPEDSLSLDKLKDSGMRDVDYDFSAFIAKKAENAIKKEEEKKEEKAVKKEEIKPEPEKENKEEIRADISAPPIRFTEAPGKIKMHDIRMPKPKIMTPVDELKYLDLVNFRRLSRESLLKAKDKIREKVRLLGEESYDKKIEGIRAWRSSPINRLYLQIGEESISKNEPIDVIIEERKARGDEYLTNIELEAVMDLNKELRF